MSKRKPKHTQKQKPVQDECVHADTFAEPDWEDECSNCGMSPTVPETGMCGPCTFGEADTIGGNW